MHSASYLISATDLWNLIGTSRRSCLAIYNALFAYLRFAAQERHGWPAKVA